MKFIISFLTIILFFSLFMALSSGCKVAPKIELPIIEERSEPPPTTLYQQPLSPIMPPQAPAEPVKPPDVAVEPEYEQPEGYEEENQNYSEPATNNSITQEIVNVFGSEWPIALAIARAESGLNPEAVNVNQNGTRDIGVFQINDHHGWTDEERFDWKNNISIAKELRDRFGWTEWSVYNNGQYRKFL